MEEELLIEIENYRRSYDSFLTFMTKLVGDSELADELIREIRDRESQESHLISKIIRCSE